MLREQPVRCRNHKLMKMKAKACRNQKLLNKVHVAEALAGVEQKEKGVTPDLAEHSGGVSKSGGIWAGTGG